ncbi:hypothetical protein KZ813_06240 [Sphingomonas sp. RHCKR7]|uniref:hypothetical protein n=1 Tax=Sphingomonas folli TaxID=2862497 RepID=UPI001CA4A661|nr:hypothetical protein [Sphingomonas folli]MBW6526435.1 hypothetical protein [Sphingomonas folli]
MADIRYLVAAAVALIVATPAAAGPPFLTDDPEPTDFRHWEIYAPLFEVDGRGAEYGGAVGAEINYGALHDLQLTVGLPLAFAHERAGYTSGRGDLELSVKYRFYHDDEHAVSIAAFPGTTLPTGARSLSARRVTALLPIWGQKNVGAWSVFGGGGYALNPGAGNRNYWTGGIAVTRTLSSHLLLGLEAQRQGADRRGGRASTIIGMGGIVQLSRTLRILGSCGPSISDGGGHAAFHAFVAGGLTF